MLAPQEADIEGQIKTLVLDVAAHKRPVAEEASKGWAVTRGLTAAIGGVARAAATRAAGVMGDMRSNRVAAVEQGLPNPTGGWQQQQMQDDDDDNSAAADWE